MVMASGILEPLPAAEASVKRKLRDGEWGEREGEESVCESVGRGKEVGRVGCSFNE
jgi:hypothetical protein